MILSGAPPGLLSKTVASPCSSVSGSISAGGVGQSQGAVFFSHTPRRFSLSSSFCLIAAKAVAGSSVEEISVANDVGRYDEVSGA